jgi:hypothetical protein
MSLELIIGIIGGIIVPVLTYYAGIRQGQRQERERREHDTRLELQRRERELVSKVTDEYVQMVRKNFDSGPHALGSLGLDHLGSDRAIRDAIHEMYVRSGQDPWSRHGNHVEDVDLVQFFRYVRENRINFFEVPVEQVARRVKDSGGLRMNIATSKI